ncbi:hypothetical protein MAAFP003_3162 [Mycobacterium ahvazicum]|uniref:Uncharacterized protein n=1 Tax=Mycobacterium ahvazicum TaxID=1964395 RepID=A0A2K4YCI0_9MYCO|nr:hypothetical protein MAAFP003_3162 [Mycobacterium ahvazicum]
MFGIANRLALTLPPAFALAVAATAMSPAISRAAQCGEGTVYDAPTNTCVVAAAQDRRQTSYGFLLFFFFKQKTAYEIA